jgi:hypothetical protein
MYLYINIYRERDRDRDRDRNRDRQRQRGYKKTSTYHQEEGARHLNRALIET